MPDNSGAVFNWYRGAGLIRIARSQEREAGHIIHIQGGALRSRPVLVRSGKKRVSFAGRLLPVDSVVKCLKWSTLRRILRLAVDKSRDANIVTLIENAP